MRLQFFAIGMSFVCPGFLIWMAPDAVQEVASYSWPEVTGEVRAVDARQEFDSETRETRYVGWVDFTYQVDGKQLASQAIDLSTGIKHDSREAALADVAEYSPGQAVKVAYNPKRPETGILKRGIPGHHLLVLVCAGVGTIVFPIVSFFIIRNWLAGRTQASA
jgi:hypothetical protein